MGDPAESTTSSQDSALSGRAGADTSFMFGDPPTFVHTYHVPLPCSTSYNTLFLREATHFISPPSSSSVGRYQTSDVSLDADSKKMYFSSRLFETLHQNRSSMSSFSNVSIVAPPPPPPPPPSTSLQFSLLRRNNRNGRCCSSTVV